ncbi:MAG: FtsX-like permease family protein [Proteobacteria bacterium]|nr:FtsX-like permease family protein [Pseudomonadota bacterium]
MSRNVKFIYYRLSAMALRNVLRNPRHSAATLLSIALGFLAVCLFDGYLTDFMRLSNDFLVKRSMMGHVVIQKVGYIDHRLENPWAYVMTPSDQKFVAEFVAHPPRVQAVVRFLDITGMLNTGSSGRYFLGYGYDVQEGMTMRTAKWAANAEAGQPLHLADPKSIVVGGRMGEAVGCQSHSNQQGDGVTSPLTCRWPRVTLSVSTEFSQVNSMLLSIAGLVDGLYEHADKHLVVMSLQNAQRLMDTDKVSMMSVSLADPSQADAFVRTLQQESAAKGIKLQVMRSHDHPLAAPINRSLTILTTFRHLFLSILVIIAVMSVINSVVKSVNERIREIGMIRSLGYHRKHIMAMFGFEGLFLGAIACGVTLPATGLLIWATNRLALRYDAGLLASPIPFGIAVAPLSWLATSSLFIVLAAVSALFASRKASTMVIADSMRFVE